MWALPALSRCHGSPGCGPRVRVRLIGTAYYATAESGWTPTRNQVSRADAIHGAYRRRVASLEEQIRALIDASGAAAVAVVVEPVDAARPSLTIEADRVFHAASTMKVAVLVELYRRAEDGELSLDDRLVVRNGFRSIADGSSYALDAADDSELTLYDREGEAETLHELAFLAITQSSNLATNLLVDLLDPVRIGAAMA